MAEEVLELIENSNNTLENNNVGTTETIMEAGGVAVVGKN